MVVQFHLITVSALEGTVNVDNVFDDYKPETVFMPRIAFSFPISDEAQFFAHYDVLTQRPPQWILFSITFI